MEYPKWIQELVCSAVPSNRQILAAMNGGEDIRPALMEARKQPGINGNSRSKIDATYLQVSFWFIHQGRFCQ